MSFLNPYQFKFVRMLFNILLSNIINVSLTYLRGLEVPELKEEDMPMAIDKQSSEANKD
tara:strand:- start:500 stop:676 length:177 start_codon:yes stop_codon:yes gene_type:complete